MHYSVGNPQKDMNINLISCRIGLFCFYHTNLGIIEPPKPCNISLNQKTILNCTAVAEYINWLVDGVNAREVNSAFEVGDPVSINYRTICGKLIVQGSKLSNGTKIICSAVKLSGGHVYTHEKSKPITILVQGKLGPVRSLSYRINLIENYAVVEWNQPFTYDGVSIKYYQVKTCITDFSTSARVESTTAILPLNLQLPSKFNYTITVKAVNEAGIGAAAQINITATVSIEQGNV